MSGETIVFEVPVAPQLVIDTPAPTTLVIETNLTGPRGPKGEPGEVPDISTIIGATKAALGTAAGFNIGTSGYSVPLLSGSNFWSAPQSFAADVSMASLYAQGAANIAGRITATGATINGLATVNMSGRNYAKFSNGASDVTPAISLGTNAGKSLALLCGTNGSAFTFDDSGVFSICADTKGNIDSGTSNGGTGLFSISGSGNATLNGALAVSNGLQVGSYARFQGGATVNGSVGINGAAAALLDVYGAGGITGGIVVRNSTASSYSAVTMFDERNSTSYVGQWGLYGSSATYANSMFFYNSAGSGIGFYIGSGNPAADLKMMLTGGALAIGPQGSADTPANTPYKLAMGTTFSPVPGTGVKVGVYTNTASSQYDYGLGVSHGSPGWSLDHIVPSYASHGFFTGGVERARITATGATISGKINAASLPTYADESSAGSGGLVQGDLYKTVTGELRVKL